MENQMLFASAMTTERRVEQAAAHLADQIEAQLAGVSPDLALMFLSPHYRLEVAELVAGLQSRLKPLVLLGCTAEGVIGRDQEIEREPAISLVAAHWPGVGLTPFILQSMDWRRTLSEAAELRDMVNAPPETKLFMLLADPFTTPSDAVLEAFNLYYPDVPIIGGMASGSQRAGGNALVFNDRVLNNGAVGLALSGAFEADIIVSQGCRTAAQPFTVTSSRENVIFSLAGQSPLTQIQTLVQNLSPADRVLLQNGLFIGRAVDSDLELVGRGDFLIRGVMGLDQESGVMVVGDYINEGETVQFHLRDAGTAEEDLEMMLAPQLLFDPPCGGFLFSCNGRGTRLYDHPNGDINIIQKVMGDSIWPVFSAPVKSGRLAARIFSTATPPAWPCFGLYKEVGSRE